MGISVWEENEILSIEDIIARIEPLELTNHSHTNKGILDLIIDSGSGEIITDYERNLITEFLVERQVEFSDNSTEYILLGNKNVSRFFILDYVLETVTGNYYQGGTIRVIHNNIETNLDNYFFSVPSKIEGMSYESDIFGDYIRLVLTASSVGSDLKFRFFLRKINNTTWGKSYG